jgi:hypothetical protein
MSSRDRSEISDHQRSWGYEDGPWKGPGAPLLVGAVFFKEYKDPSYRVVAIYAKKARGLMCNYIIQNRITRVEDLQSFNSDGYRFAPAQSSEREWVFTRGDVRA